MVKVEVLVLEIQVKVIQVLEMLKMQDFLGRRGIRIKMILMKKRNYLHK